MNRADLIKLLEKNNFILVREGGSHTVYERNGKIEMVPRHREINELLAKAIIKRNNLK